MLSSRVLRLAGTAFLAVAVVATARPLPVAGGTSAAYRAPATATPVLEGIPRLDHVVVIVLENEPLTATWGLGSPARYLNALRSYGTLLTQYYGAGHESNDNYISMTSGQSPNPDTMADCLNWSSCEQVDSSPAVGGGVSLPDQLEGAGLSWKGYMEDMPAPCTHAAATSANDPYQGNSTAAPGYNYADRHNPFIYYAPIVANTARCAAHVVPYTTLASDLAAQALPNFSYIVPNTCNDGHDVPTCANGQTGGLGAADAWLQQNVPPLLSYVMAHNGLLVITTDESANSDISGCCGGGIGAAAGFGGSVGLLALSPHVPAGAEIATPYDHPSLLRTIEDAFGISTYLNNAAAPTEHAMSDVFTADPSQSRPGPTTPTGTYGKQTVLPSGRLVSPTGHMVTLGDFPLGVAVSPDGRLVAAINSGMGDGTGGGTGNYCGPTQSAVCPPGASSAGALPGPDESLDVISLPTGTTTVLKTAPTSADPAHPSFNFFYTGVTFSPDGQHLYASGGGNDAVYDFPVHNDQVGPAPLMTVTVPDTFKSEPAVPPLGSGNAFTKGLAVTPDGRYLLVTQEFQNALDIIDTRTYATSQVPLSPPAAAGGAYPYGVTVSHDGATAYVAEQGLNAVAVVQLAAGSGALLTTVPVGDHPTALALSPDGTQLYVANANDDTVSILTIDATGLPTPAATLPLHALPGESLGATPNALTVAPDGQRVYVALAGDDAVAVLGTAASLAAPVTATVSVTITAATPNGTQSLVVPASPAASAWQLGGLLPSAWYPSGVATSPNGATLYVVSAKGLGSRYPGTTLGPAIVNSYYSVNTNMAGVLQSVAIPYGAALDAATATVQRDLQAATFVDTGRGAHSPIPAAPVTSPTQLSAATPIKYVIEIVRENRTFDQELGDLAQDEGRNQPGTDTVDAQPAYVTFGRGVTPNAHALAGDPTAGPTAAFATADNFYSDGEASVQGHWWTAAANVGDYVEKSWRQYYSNRNHVQDTVSPVSAPHNCTIFQSALARQATDPTFSFRDYGELVGVANPSVPSVTAAFPGLTNPCAALPDANFSLAASSQLSLTQDDRKTARGFLGDIGLNPDGSETITSTLGLAYLRNFSYVIMGGDHTYGLNGYSSPRAIVAQNDAGLGMIVHAISRSKYWPNTAIFVMEDDSQDGLDHRDGHRNLLYVISPYAKHTGLDGKPGYVSHLHYSQTSVLKTIELLTGLPYLSTYDQNASALYDLFQDKDGTPGYTPTAADLAPYDLQPAPPCIDETAAQVKAANPTLASVVTVESRHLNLSAIDRAGPMLEIINWQLAHPTTTVPAQLLQEQRVWAARHSLGGAGDRGEG